MPTKGKGRGGVENRLQFFKRLKPMRHILLFQIVSLLKRNMTLYSLFLSGSLTFRLGERVADGCVIVSDRGG